MCLAVLGSASSQGWVMQEVTARSVCGQLHLQLLCPMAAGHSFAPCFWRLWGSTGGLWAWGLILAVTVPPLLAKPPAPHPSLCFGGGTVLPLSRAGAQDPPKVPAMGGVMWGSNRCAPCQNTARAKITTLRRGQVCGRAPRATPHLAAFGVHAPYRHWDVPYKHGDTGMGPVRSLGGSHSTGRGVTGRALTPG